MGRDRAYANQAAAIDMFQSTRPRGARHYQDLQRTQSADVSIHAPAWGATVHCCAHSKRLYLVSIHAPAWGATGPCHSTKYTRHGFNPRARVGRDQLPGCLLGLPLVSIHAPAWGATLFAISLASSKVCFNPRARVGRDMLHKN